MFEKKIEKIEQLFNEIRGIVRLLNYHTDEDFPEPPKSSWYWGMNDLIDESNMVSIDADPFKYRPLYIEHPEKENEPVKIHEVRGRLIFGHYSNYQISYSLYHGEHPPVDCVDSFTMEKIEKVKDRSASLEKMKQAIDEVNEKLERKLKAIIDELQSKKKYFLSCIAITEISSTFIY